MSGVHANFESLEGNTGASGTAAVATTLTLVRKSRKIIITNDHPTEELQYKFNASETYGTLHGTESISLYFITKTIFISGHNAPYRIWVYG